MKNKIIELLRSTERPGIENLIKYMEESDFFTAPCSTQYHLCKEGGLAEHSLNVFYKMFDLAAAWGHIRPLEEDQPIHDNIVISALLHDIGKSTYRGKPNYMPNFLKSGEISKAKPYETNTDRLYISHEIVSLQIINKYIELTEEEEFAILYHNGMYVSSGRDINGKERPLQLLLHFADMWCSRFVEVE
jgi:23S rRNA maturation-related 3'-5' exoribonuclease YhaM